MVKLAVAAMLGHKLRDSQYGTGLYRRADYYAVKVPVFSNAKLTNMDMALGPEMKSTGEVLGIDKDLSKAIYKGFLAAGTKIPTEGNIFVTLRDPDKNAGTAKTLKRYEQAGFKLYASEGTGAFMHKEGIAAEVIPYEKAKEMIGEEIQMVINTPKVANRPESDTFPIRRKAIERGLPVLTCMDTAAAFLIAISLKQKHTRLEYYTL